MTSWTWEDEGHEAADERLGELLCTLGDGCFATRGPLPEGAADDVHHPGTYGAGCYNRLTSDVAGRQVENEGMVDVPKWLPLRFRLPEQQLRTPDTASVLDHHQACTWTPACWSGVRGTGWARGARRRCHQRRRAAVPGSGRPSPDSYTHRHRGS